MNEREQQIRDRHPLDVEVMFEDQDGDDIRFLLSELDAARQQIANMEDNQFDGASIARTIDHLTERAERSEAALEKLLSVVERRAAGDRSLDPEEWYAIRDYARVVLASRPGGTG